MNEDDKSAVKAEAWKQLIGLGFSIAAIIAVVMLQEDKTKYGTWLARVKSWASPPPDYDELAIEAELRMFRQQIADWEHSQWP